MFIVESTLRALKVPAGLMFCLALLPATAHAFTQDDQRRLCTGDVFRLCSSEIPDVDRITTCMYKQRASLSEGCRSVFGRASGQSASLQTVRHHRPGRMRGFAADEERDHGSSD